MTDGTHLAARIWLPEDAESLAVPTLLECMPYRKRDFTRLRDEPLHHYFAGNGYASVRLDLRGSGDSEGLLEDEYAEQEQDDIIEALQWIEQQSWSNGRVGMFGISWGGFNSLQVAARRPPQLKAIITMCSTDDRYTDDAHYKGGCLLTENLNWGAVFLSSANAPPDPAIVGSGWRDQWRRRLEKAVLYPATWMRHPHRDAYWKHGSVCEDYAAIECPVYAVGGWADGYSNAILRLMAELSAPKKALIGPWSHAFPHVGAPGPSIGFFQEMRRWWDHWLKEVDTGIMDEPPIRVWLEDYVRPAPAYDERPGRWVAEPSWPSPRIRPRQWFLNVLSLGDSPAAEDRMYVRSPQTAGLAAGDWYGFGAEGESPVDQREDDGKSMIFDSDPLTERVEILGTPVVHLELAVDCPVAYVIVRLNDVASDGASTRVTYGVLNLTHRDSHEHPAPLEPGRRYRIRLALNDTAYAFPEDHTIRLAISTSYWPVVWPAPEPVKLTLFTGASTLELPARPPSDVDAGLRRFEPPERGPRAEATSLKMTPLRRTVERDLTTGDTVYRVFSDSGEFNGAALAHIEDIDLTVGYTIEKTYRIGEYEPGSAEVIIEQDMVHRRDDWSTRLHCLVRLTVEGDNFRLRATMTAYDNDEVFVVREWDEPIPRLLL
ncbi:MAG: CocE/NonD family hydrolase [Halioglobus sp.]|nr:CocE/NonD family hydrolase [Halioglobus sp.]